MPEPGVSKSARTRGIKVRLDSRTPRRLEVPDCKNPKIHRTTIQKTQTRGNSDLRELPQNPNPMKKKAIHLTTSPKLYDQT